MKSFLLVLCAILAIFAFAQADECKIEGHVVKVGETYSLPGKCTEIKCTGPNAFTAKTCPQEHSLKPCKYIPQDNSKPYPECCPRHDC
ncbi:venom peptide Pc-like [Lucilia sericata]|uniref:venom peptide Pc-like n=1 Tax=Lucilia sericata TaxID=13632 RepID=UPI0018A818C1|nr:venom peptide Pc-like [Lucilia sericata]